LGILNKIEFVNLFWFSETAHTLRMFSYRKSGIYIDLNMALKRMLDASKQTSTHTLRSLKSKSKNQVDSSHPPGIPFFELEDPQHRLKQVA